MYHWPSYSSTCSLAPGACPTPEVERGSHSHWPWNAVDCEILPPPKSVIAAGRIWHIIWHFIQHRIPRLDWQYESQQWTQCCPSRHSCIFKAEKGHMGGPHDESRPYIFPIKYGLPIAIVNILAIYRLSTFNCISSDYHLKWHPAQSIDSPHSHLTKQKTTPSFSRLCITPSHGSGQF